MIARNIAVLVASDVSSRDGIGVEIYEDGRMVLEIFRDDTKKTRDVAMFQETIPLDLLEEAIAIFKKRIDWDFIDDDPPEI